MVPFALPGERVRARVFRNYKNYSEADLIEVLQSSPNRVEPGCNLFGICGGCQYQHLRYEEQLKWKQSQVKELFEKALGHSVDVAPTHASPQEYHYRSKLTPHYPKPRKGEELPIGFLRQGHRNRIVDVPTCPIAMHSINEALPSAREQLAAKRSSLKRGGTLLLRATKQGVTDNPKETVSEYIGDKVFQFEAGSFFQNNPYILPEFVDYAVKEARSEGIHYLIDAYCGVGVFALCASEHFKRCAGVEVSASAVRWAGGNACINGIKNCEFILGEAEHIFEEVDFPSSETAMIIDPPRKGCDEAFLKQLIAFGPKRLVYVSCDPATQARDLTFLVGRGYTIERIQPFDLFPQTRHIENIVTLRAD
ncbi:MAG TPA: SAM-dependent methyltransferase [Opitutae bacterium]|nr:SAM-dependent methyltransferase [Opitutae bacterium]